jgi:hypothetical protein
MPADQWYHRKVEECGAGWVDFLNRLQRSDLRPKPGPSPTVAEIVAAIPSSNAQAAPPLRDGLARRNLPCNAEPAHVAERQRWARRMLGFIQ